MRLRTVLALLLALGVFAAAGCAAKAATPTGNAAAAAGVPGTLSFDGTTLDGKPFRAADLAGRPVVLWFWAPWCATCASQADSVGEVATTYAGKLSVLGVAGLGETKAMHEFVSDTGVSGVTHLNDRAGAVWRQFRITEQSSYVFLDGTGKVVHSGYLDDTQFQERVAALAG